MRLARFGIATAVCAALFVRGTPSAAESALGCVEGSIVEIFAGSPDCPDADYVVLEVTGGYGPQVNTVFLEDHCGAAVGVFSDYAYPYVTPQPPSKIWIARPEAEALFGISADVSATGHVPVPDGRIAYACFGGPPAVAYGAYSNGGVPQIELGKALKRVGNQWELSAPSPINSQGAVGTLGTCPVDAGVDADADADAAGGASADAASLPPCLGGNGGAGGGSGGNATGGSDAGGASASGGLGNAGNTHGGASSDASAAGSRERADDGCGCRVGTNRRGGASIPWIALLAIGLLRGRMSRATAVNTAENFKPRAWPDALGSRDWMPPVLRLRWAARLLGCACGGRVPP